MTTHHKTIAIRVDQEHLTGTLVRPATPVPGVLLVHGRVAPSHSTWHVPRQIAVLSCVCLTFDRAVMAARTTGKTR